MSTENKPLRPILKYPGGKRRELPNILRHIPDYPGRYIEPFVGGGALYFHLNPERAWINDLNKNLMGFYDAIGDDVIGPALIRQIEVLSQAYKEMTERERNNLYLSARQALNGKGDGSLSPEIVYYLVNRTAFGGVVRVNKKGEFNVPFGKYKTLKNTITEDHIALLNRTDITAVDYRAVLAGVRSEDFVFLDPPYDTQYSNYGNTEPFGETEHRELAEQFHALRSQAMMVLNVTPLTQRLYKGLIEEVYPTRYAINRRIKNPDLTHHMVVTNY